jgi:type I restriction enzyme M protein
VVTGELKSKIDRIWDAFWSGGISNPLEVIEQITYLLFLRRLDDLQTLAESKARVTRGVIEEPMFLPGQQQLRWGRFKNDAPAAMHQRVARDVFPFLQKLGDRIGGDGSTYGEHMRDARFTIPTPALLAKVVDMLDDLPMTDRDTNGDLYEYLLSKIASAGVNGQFRTPAAHHPAHGGHAGADAGRRDLRPCLRHGGLPRRGLGVRPREAPGGADRREAAPALPPVDVPRLRLRLHDAADRQHEHAAPRHRVPGHPLPGLTLGGGERGHREVHPDLGQPAVRGVARLRGHQQGLQRVVKTKKTELLFLALFLELLKPGGRAAVIVPDGVLFGSSKAHKDLRRILVEDQKLDAVVKLPSGVFRPYAGVSTAILFFTRTDSGGTDAVWFYDIRADGFSLDDKRTPIEASDLPDALARWPARTTTERERGRTDQSFTVPKADIVAQGYDLSLNRYREVVHNEVQHRPPLEIIADIEALEEEIAKGLAELRAELS